MIPADVTDDASMDAAFASVKEKWGKIDFLVHSIAFAGKDELVGSMVENTTREGFRRAMDISVYSASSTAPAARLKSCRMAARSSA
jgi:enoyl-[acyl-carrier protein] reductase I